MQGLNSLVGKKIALVDRNFLVVEGRVVYPTTSGTLIGATDKILYVQLAENEDATLFFVDSLRCIRDVSSMPAPAQGSEP